MQVEHPLAIHSWMQLLVHIVHLLSQEAKSLTAQKFRKDNEPIFIKLLGCALCSVHTTPPRDRAMQCTQPLAARLCPGPLGRHIAQPETEPIMMRGIKNDYAASSQL